MASVHRAKHHRRAREHRADDLFHAGLSLSNAGIGNFGVVAADERLWSVILVTKYLH